MRNKFDVSDGNLKVLETIPKMMKDEIYRNKLRFLVMDFEFNNKEKNAISTNSALNSQNVSTESLGSKPSVSDTHSQIEKEINRDYENKDNIVRNKRLFAKDKLNEKESK